VAPHPFIPQPLSQKPSVACQVQPDRRRQEEQEVAEEQDLLSSSSSVEVAMERERAVPRVKAKTKRRMFLFVLIGVLSFDVQKCEF